MVSLRTHEPTRGRARPYRALRGDMMLVDGFGYPAGFQKHCPKGLLGRPRACFVDYIPNSGISDQERKKPALKRAFLITDSSLLLNLRK